MNVSRPSSSSPKLLPAVTAALAAAGLVSTAQAQFTVAGTLYVDLRATNSTAGAATWNNQGTLGSFAKNGTPSLVNNVNGTGIPGVLFNGTTDWYLGPATVADLEGSSDRSIEVWVLNPAIATEETLVAWAHRGSNGQNMSMNYGSSSGSGGFGAAGHWGSAFDVGWATAAPTANAWHHIVYTYSGTTCNIYVDGTLNTSKAVGTLNSFAGFTIVIGGQHINSSPFTGVDTAQLLSGYINAVRVHGGALTGTDVANNYRVGPWAPTQIGRWASDSDGNWSDTTKWDSGYLPLVTADFSTLDITSDRVVTLDSARTMGALLFGDTSGSQNWKLTGANTLTLGGGLPFITVNQNTSTVDVVVAGTTGFSKAGAGTLVLNKINTYTGSTFVKGGTVVVETGASYASSSFNSIGQNGTDNGTLTVKGGVTVNADFNVSDINSSMGTMNVQGTGTVSVSTLFVGKANTTTGTVNQISGTVQRSTGGGDWRIGGGNSASDVASLGTYNLSGGVLLPNGNLQIGAFGNGTLNQSGGAVNVAAGFPVIGRFAGGVGNLNISGGAFTQAVAGTFLIIGEQGTGTVTVSNTGVLVIQGTTGLRLAHAAGGVGTVNLGGGVSGGTIITPAVSTAAGASSTFNFNGGTLKANAASATFVQGLTAANVQSGGAAIDDGGFAITVGQTLLDGGGGGGLTKSGAGTLTLSANNTYTGPSSINAGTLQLGAGGTTGTLGVNTGPVLNNGTLAFNRSDNLSWDRQVTGSGGLTKLNNNTVSLTASNTYSGNTIIGAGTLVLAATGSISNSTQIAVGSGATFDVSAVSGFALNGAVGQVLSGNGVVTGSVAAASGAQISPGASAGTLSFSNSLTLSGGVTNRFELTNVVTEGSSLNDEIIVAGNLNLSGINRILITPTGGDLANGRYKLIRYGGTRTGGAANFTVAFTSPLPQVVANVDDSVAGEIDLVVGHRLNFGLPAVTNIDTTTADFGVRVTDDGGVTIDSWGVAYGLAPAPAASVPTGIGPANAPLDILQPLNGLTPGAHYYVRGWASNAVEGRVYSAETNFYTEPIAASGLTFANVSNRTMTISWTADPSSVGSVVFIRQGSPVAFVPSDGTTYTGTNLFGAGADLGGGTYVLFTGSGSSVSARELSKNTTYYVAVFAYSGAGAFLNYQQDTPAAGGQTTGNAASIETAGQLLIDLDVSRGIQTTPAGAATNWQNFGTVGGGFLVDGTSDTYPSYGTASSQPAVSFDGGDRLKATFTAPPQITGTNAQGQPNTYSVEYWVLNPSIANEEWLFTFARRNTSPRYAAFGYGTNNAFGFTAHWATPDMAFGEGISTPGLASTPAAGVWHHFVVTYDGITERGYVDGVLNAQEAKVLNIWDGDPVTLGQTYTFPALAYTTTIPFSGSVSALRVHSGVLTPGQIVDNYGVGQLAAPVYVISQSGNVTVGECGSATFTALAGGSQPITYQWYRNGSAIPGATGTSYTLVNAQVPDSGAQFTCVASNFVNGNASTATTAVATLTVVNAAASLTHRYSFTTDATDSVGGAHGTLLGNATISGGQLNLDGSVGTYAELPGGIINGYSNVTVEFWASFGVNPNWSRVFDFGDTNAAAQGRRYIFFTPHSGPGDHRMSIADGDPGGNHEQVATGAGTLDGVSNIHVACVWDTVGGVLSLYTNGVLESSAAATIPLSNISNVLSWIGRSLYAADGWLNGSIDELRIYNSALSAGKVLQSYQQGTAVPLADGAAVFTQQPQSQTIECGGNISFSATAVGQCGMSVTYQWFFGANAITDATNTTLTLTGVSPANAGNYSARATSSAGTATSAVAVLTVVDTTPPTIVCSTDRVAECTNGAGTVVGFVVTASDICDASPAVTCSPPSGFAFPPGTNTVRCVAVDASGNSNSCSFLVIIQDTTAPTLICPPDVAVQCDASVPAPNFAGGSVSDACDPSPVVIHVGDVASGSCPRTITRTYRATDASGNTVTCTQIITVHDTIPPTITCGQNQTVACGMAWDFTVPPVSDNCGSPTLSIASTVTNATCGNMFVATRVWQATDLCGNSTLCTQVVTVVDTTAPSITCPADTSVQCFADVPAPDLSAVVATDSCNSVTRSFVGDTYATNGCVITVTRTYKAVDACSNSATCTQIITVHDTIPPTIACGQNQTVPCGMAWDFVVPPVSDNCGNPTLSIVSTVTNATCGNMFVATRVWQAMDLCGNSALCTQVVTVVDTTAPSITCPADTSVQCFADVPAPDLSAVIATDSCNSVTKSFVGDSYVTNGCVIMVTRTYKAVDACTNSATCTQRITVHDTIPPTITCGQNQTVPCGMAWDFTVPPVSDNCGSPTLSIASTVTNATCGNMFVATRVWQATDLCGNSTLCTQVVTVVDTTAPSITCPADTSVQCFNDIPAPDLSAVIATDSCNSVTRSFVGDTYATNGCVITVTRTYKAVDACTNAATCTQRITVHDTIPPTIDCTHQTFECGLAWNFSAVVADNCGAGGVTLVPMSTTTNANCGATFVARRVWQATDGCGNSTTCTQVVTVVDTTAPSISHCATNRSIATDMTGIAPVPDLRGEIIASDCSGSVIVAQDPPPGTQVGPGQTVVRLFVSDDCHNTNTCSATLSVFFNNHPPVAVDKGAATTQNRPLTFAAGKFLGGSSDPDGDVVTLASVSATSTNGGSVVLTNDTVIYTPQTNFTGVDRFSYTLSDGHGGFATAIMEIFVVSGSLPSNNQVSIMTTSNGILIRFAGVPGRSYQIQRAPGMTGPWTTLATRTAALHGIIEYEDTNPPQPMAFYRTVSP